MQRFIIICCVIAAACIQLSQSIATCPEIRSMKNLDTSYKLFGTWYGCQESVTIFPDMNKCTSLIMEPNGPFGWSVIFSGVSNKTGIRTSYTATITTDEHNHAITSVHYNSIPPGPLTIGVTILDTDYDNYMILWSCMDDQPQQTPGLWILVKNRLSCKNFSEKVKDSMDEIGVNLTMNSVDHVNCT